MAGRDKHGGVTVRRTFCEQLRAHGGARTGAVIHHQLLAQRFDHFRRQRAKQEIAVASRSGGVDDAHEFVGELLCRHAAAHCDQQQGGSVAHDPNYFASG